MQPLILCSPGICSPICSPLRPRHHPSAACTARWHAAATTSCPSGRPKHAAQRTLSGGHPGAQELERTIDSFAEDALRTLILAYADVPLLKGQGFSAEDEIPYTNLTAIALVGIKDPCRPGVPESVQKCQEAGIVVRMVTGDNKTTAVAIARECNIFRDGDLAIEGPEFRALPRAEALKLLPRLRVLARSSPTDKHTLVVLLRSQGEVVAVTGDGTNDAPALHEADIGLSMGIAGTEARLLCSL